MRLLYMTKSGHYHSRPILDEQGVTNVVFASNTPAPHGSRIDSLFGFCPSSEDSIYLGEALDDILWWDETSPHSLDSLTKVFEARRAEVHERSRLQHLGDWSFDNGWFWGKINLLERTSDPAEDVIERNCM